MLIISSIIVAIVGIVILNILYRKLWDNLFLDVIQTFCMILTIISIAFSVVGSIKIIENQINKETAYQNKLAERQMLEYRLSKQEELTGNELLYTQIVDFNNDLRETKKWANNIWTNWFYNQDIANKIDYITIEGIKESIK